MNPFSKLASGIPLDEAAAFFLKLKTASAPVEPPDETGQLEGQFAAPVEQVLAQMASMVQNELKTHYAYIVYSQTLRDLAREGIAEEFLDHADHETEHAEFLLRRLAVLGGPADLPDIPAPPASTDPNEIVQTMIRMEQEGIANWRQLLALVGDENPTKYKIEEYLGEELEHLDELWQLIPHTARPAVVNEQPGAQPPAPAPAPAQPEAPKPAAPAAPAEEKTASAPLPERHHPDTLRYHGSVMKMALAAMSPTVFVPTIDEDGNIKQAAARLAKAAEGMALSPLGDQAMGKVAPPAPAAPLSGPAAGVHAKVAARFKQAFEQLEAPPSAPVPGGKEEQELQAYLEEEQANQAMQEEAEEGHYKDRFQQAAQQLQQLQEENAQLQQQVQGLEAQVGQNNEVQQQAMAQAQQIQDAAMQQSTAANAAAASAMQKALASQQELLQQQQLAIQMRDAMQAMKTQVLGLVQQQLPPATTMEAGMSAQADQAHADQQALQEQQAMAMGQDPNAAAQGGGAPPAGGDPSGGAAPAAAPAQAAPAGPPGQQIPPEQKKPSSSSSDASGGSEKKESDSSEKSASDRFVGALVGGALGAGSTAIESQMSNDPLRAKVKKLQAAEQAGEGGFGNAMNLAQARMRLALGELAENHPVGASIAGGLAGAATGAGAAPHARQLIDAIRG